ncbi:MAG: EAL domain-containing protein [Idiomarina sp.]|nr:EAL domain-containing protein [Idiomarina sp.]
MAGISFRARLLLLLSGLVALALGVVILAIFLATESSVKRNIDRELGVSERVFLQLLEQRENQLTQAATVLADDFGFRQAVASADENTILSALVNHAQRIEADLITQLSPNGSVIVSTHDITNADALLDLGQGHNNAAFGMTVVENELYQLVAVPVRAPHLIGFVVLGFVINDALAVELQQITNTQISFVAHRPGADVIVVSSSQGLVDDGLRQAVEDEPSLYHWLASIGLRGQWIDLLRETDNQPGTEMQLHVLLTASIKEASEPFAPLQRHLLVVALLTMFATMLLALLTGRQVVKPVRMLADAAQRIGGGQYDQPVHYNSRDELGQLATSFNQMQSAISQREQQISYQSNHDLLTDLPNQRYLAHYTDALINQTSPFGLLILNLNNFTQLNDMFGQTICNQLLVILAQRLQNMASDSFWPARVHGDEFVVVLNGDIEPSIAQIDGILAAMSPPLKLNGLSYTISLSAGLAHYPGTAQDLDTLIRRAQFARIQARGEGKAYGVYQPGEDEPHMRKLAVSAALSEAIANEQLSLVYQPQIYRNSRSVGGAEALVRWHHPTLGFISPMEFIPLAEQSGEIHQITHWVLARAIEQLVQWRASNSDLRMSVNLSAADLSDAGLPEFILQLLDSQQVPPAALLVEVTESAMMSDPVVAVRLLETLRSRGVGVAVDDYGTGYSSLAQLRGLPADELKIDRAFVTELDNNKQDQTIVASTIELAHNLGMKVVAEGVETAGVWQALAERNCDILQGYYISRPMPAGDFANWLAEFNYSDYSPEQMTQEI